MTFRPLNVRRAQLRNQDAQLYRLANPELVAFLERKAAEVAASGSTFDFPAKMLSAIAQYGGLTPNQRAAVDRMIIRDREYAAIKRSEAMVPPPSVDASKIQAAFDKAKSEASRDGEGIKWLKLRADTFVFSPASEHSRNPGAIYVKEGGTYLGKITGGKFHKVRECTEDQAKRIACVAADPAEAARAYGLRTGNCGICGRELTNPESRARGIGPICAERLGLI